jgi:hypothetical protein
LLLIVYNGTSEKGKRRSTIVVLLVKMSRPLRFLVYLYILFSRSFFSENDEKKRKEKNELEGEDEEKWGKESTNRRYVVQRVVSGRKRDEYRRYNERDAAVVLTWKKQNGSKRKNEEILSVTG